MSSPQHPAAAGRGVTVGQKFLGVVALCIGLLAVVAGYSIFQMNAIGKELVSIAEQDIPLTNKVSAITVHQLEQAVNLERAIRYGLEMEADSSIREHFDHAVEVFWKNSEKVNKEIKESEELAQGAIEHAATEEARAEFEHVLSILEKIETEHKTFDQHAGEAIDLLASGRVDQAMPLVEKIEVEEEAIDKELEALLQELQAFTAEAALSAEEHEKTAFKVLIVLSLLAAVIGFGLSHFMAQRMVSRPLARVTGALDALAAGDTSITVEVRSRDEIGRLAQAFGTFREQTIEAQRQREEQAEQERRVEEEKRRQMLELADKFESSVGGIVGTVASAATELQQSAEAMSATAEETGTQSTAVAAASEQAAGNVQTVASAAEELTASIGEISRQITESNSISERAAKEADETNQSVKGLAEAAQKIGEVVNLISEIAEQTNLLALNATIEAARAGEAGKGFAVVASEVKSLANQTAKATEEIGAQVQGMQEATTGTVESIDGITRVIKQISENAAAIASAVEEQNASTQEISRNVQQAAAGTQEVASNITGVQQAADQAGSAASQVLSAAEELSKQSEALRGEVDGFVGGLRSA